MALKFEVESLEGVDENVQPLYEKGDDGKFRLSVDGIPKGDDSELEKLRESVAALESKNQEILAARSKAKKEAEKAALDAAKKAGDVEALEKSWQDKVTALEQESQEKVSTYESMVYKLTVQAEATRLASELAIQGSSAVLYPHIERRMKVEADEGEPRIRILDDKGKPTAMTLEDLKKEIKNNPSFAPIVQGSKGSGTGHQRGDRGAPVTGKRSEMNVEQKSAFIREHGREAYLKLPA